MKRPANEAKVLERIRGWREICPDIAIRSTFIVGFPGETEEDFDYLLDWLDEAQLDRVGAFRFEPVSGAAANALPGIVPEEVKEERYARFMEKTAAISAAKLAGQDRPHDRRDHRRGRRARAAPPAAPRPMRRRSTARSICATPATWRRATSSRCSSRMPTSMTCSVSLVVPGRGGALVRAASPALLRQPAVRTPPPAMPTSAPPGRRRPSRPATATETTSHRSADIGTDAHRNAATPPRHGDDLPERSSGHGPGHGRGGVPQKSSKIQPPIAATNDPPQHIHLPEDCRNTLRKYVAPAPR